MHLAGADQQRRRAEGERFEVQLQVQLAGCEQHEQVVGIAVGRARRMRGRAGGLGQGAH
jgi:hypothetical protein